MADEVRRVRQRGDTVHAGAHDGPAAPPRGSPPGSAGPLRCSPLGPGAASDTRSGPVVRYPRAPPRAVRTGS